MTLLHQLNINKLSVQKNDKNVCICFGNKLNMCQKINLINLIYLIPHDVEVLMLVRFKLAAMMLIQGKFKSSFIQGKNSILFRLPFGTFNI